MKKFNLALLPKTKSSEVIELAKRLESFAGDYLLGIGSLPHVTLYQFYYEKREIPALWQHVLKHWTIRQLNLSFEKISYLPFNNKYWVSLLPDKQKQLHELHAFIARLLQKNLKETFDPHMTLCSSYHPLEEEKIFAHLQYKEMIKDNFVLALGESDEVGQFKKVIYQY